MQFTIEARKSVNTFEHKVYKSTLLVTTRGELFGPRVYRLTATVPRRRFTPENISRPLPHFIASHWGQVYAVKNARAQ